MPEEKDDAMSRFVWDVDDIEFDDEEEKKKKKDGEDEDEPEDKEEPEEEQVKEPVTEAVLVDGLRFYSQPEMAEKYTLVRVKSVNHEIPEDTAENNPIDAKGGVYAVRVKNEDGKEVLAAVLFSKEKFGDDRKKVFDWIREHGFMVFQEKFETLYAIPPLFRNMFNHRLDLLNEWRNYYMEALQDGKPMPRVWAWYRFKEIYGKSSSGRWTKKEK